MPTQLLYVSNTYRDPEPGMLEEILDVSQINNARLGITGMLLYVDGGFLQVLEGEESPVSNLLNKIESDKRHWNTHILWRRSAEPIFRGWSMGFHRVEANEGAIFQISSAAIEGRLANDQQPVLFRLIENFYRIQTGESGLAGN